MSNELVVFRVDPELGSWMYDHVVRVPHIQEFGNIRISIGGVVSLPNSEAMMYALDFVLEKLSELGYTSQVSKLRYIVGHESFVRTPNSWTPLDGC